MKQKNNIRLSPIPITWVSVNDIAVRFGVSRNTVWRWARTPETGFPEPVRLTPRVTRWRQTDVERFESQRAETVLG